MKGRILARLVANAFLAEGPWTLEGLVARGGETVGKRLPWVRSLARVVLQAAIASAVTLGALLGGVRAAEAAPFRVAVVTDGPAARTPFAPEIIERQIAEVNLGVYAFDGRELVGALPKLESKNAQGEYYLTDVIGMLVRARKPVVAVEIDDVE